jgi:hypothetical protein
MSLFGSKCVRCGTRTRRRVDALPTCDTCEVQLRAEREAAYPCPLDATPMTKEVIANVVVDRCPQCHGVWLDKGELALLQSAAREEGSDFASGFVAGMIIG